MFLGILGSPGQVDELMEMGMSVKLWRRTKVIDFLKPKSMKAYHLSLKTFCSFYIYWIISQHISSELTYICASLE